MPMRSWLHVSRRRSLRQLRPILLAEKLAVRAAAGAVHPGGVVAVPLDGFVEAALPGFARAPGEVGFDFVRVDGVTPVVAGAIFDVADQGVRLAKASQDGFDDVDVPARVAGADVVNA